MTDILKPIKSNDIITPENSEDIKIKKNKKKSKKSKKFSFKKFLKNAMKSSKTDEERKKDHQDKIKESLGGGKFTKIDII